MKPIVSPGGRLKWLTTASHFLRFMLMGVPAFLIALVFNYLLVSQWHLPVALAYATVMLLQLKISFYLVHRFVFDLPEHKGYWRAFGQFLSGAIVFRLLDWLAYLGLVHLLGVYYIWAQLINITCFSCLRFLYARWIFSNRVVKLP